MSSSGDLTATQLAYLNRALRLVGPTLVCPTAFCFYNATSILSGLIYYRQFDALRPLQASLIGFGSAVLLAGVWVVSVKPVPAQGCPSPSSSSAAAAASAVAAQTGGRDGGITGVRGRKDKVGAAGSGRGDGDAGSGLSMDEMGGYDDDDDFVDSEDDDDDESDDESDDGLGALSRLASCQPPLLPTQIADP